MTAGPQYDVSVVIPAYNEKATITQVIDDINYVMRRTHYLYEILVVDDCSDDGTPGLLENRNDIRLVKHKHNLGSGASRRTGIVEARGEFIVMIDGDGTYPASAIPELLSYIPEYDQVNGARNKEAGSMKLLRIPAKWFIKSLACFLTNQKIPDLNTGLKAFKRDIALEYLWVLPSGFSCVTTLTLSFLCNGYSVKYVPIDYYPRKEGSSKFHPFSDTYNYLATVVRMITYFQPMKVFLPLSAFIFIIAFIKTLVDFFTAHRFFPSDIVLFVVSFIIFCMGVLADLIVSQAKRISYSIDDKHHQTNL